MIEAKAEQLSSLGITAPLQTIASKFQLRLGSTGGITQDASPQSLYQLQYQVRKMMPAASAAHCCVSIQTGSATIQVRLHVSKQGEQVASYEGVYHCGNVWTCPICAHKIALRRRDEIAQVIDQARQAGYRVYFLTLTVRHSIEESLDGIKLRFANARRVMRNRRAWKAMSKAASIAGYIRGVEVTYGESGWHYHSHEIIICRPDAGELESDVILQEWKAACKASHLKIPDEHGVELREAGTKDEAGYPVKNDLAEEVTSGMWKTPNGNYTPWGLLILGSQHGGFLMARFAEYAKVMPGTKRIMFSPGLRALFGISEVQSEAEVSEKPEGQTVFVIDQADWDLIIRHEQRRQVLKLFVRYELQEAINHFTYLMKALRKITKQSARIDPR